MNSDLFYLLNLFIENGSMTSQEIAYYCQVTERTVATRVQNLNEILGNRANIFKKVKRYQLVINNYSEFTNLETKFLKGELDLNDQIKREAYILDLLIKKKDYLTIDEIADQILISRTVFNGDIKQIRKILKEYGGKIISKQGKGIKIVFNSEYQLLFAYRNLIVQHISKSSWTKLSNEFAERTEKLALNKETSMQITENLVALYTVKNYGYDLKSMPEKFVRLWDDSSLVNSLNSVCSCLITDLTQVEKEFLLSPLNLYKNSSISAKAVQEMFAQNLRLLFLPLSKELARYHLNFEAIYERMKWHVLFSINRELLKEKVSEILPQDISKKYPIALELSIKLADLIFKEYQIEFSKNEINYLVVYFEIFLEEQPTNLTDRINIAFVGNIRGSVKQFIIEKLEKIFENLKITDFASLSEIKNSQQKFLLVFSNEPFLLADTQVINIGTALRQEALSAIVQTSIIEHFISQNLCSFNTYKVKAKSYFAATEQIIDKEIANGELREDFKENWSEREKYTNNIFSNGIAIPHAIDSSGKKRILLSVGIIQNKLAFKNRDIKLIFLIGIPQIMDNKLIDVTSRIYDLIGNISRNEVLFRNIIKYDNSKSFLQITEGI
ncbi:HTH domain-containing protein [Lactobacillus sp. ESL0791]|uniref:BglG family transcription antiterminator n=1 Tax=Lactobacillus sp. ESL0791 TaxID=2983234 RepID=UPI0023FA024F|nr:HTH domain-containing protein [Lactobacillus sp. ESL0791]MDF7638624.1 HTH domain-containing protein [Lactobacillus sp. ESL0791]